MYLWKTSHGQVHLGPTAYRMKCGRRLQVPAIPITKLEIDELGKYVNGYPCHKCQKSMVREQPRAFLRAPNRSEIPHVHRWTNQYRVSCRDCDI